MKLVRKDDQLIVVERLKMAESFADRLIGLMFKKEMKGFDGLLIKDCRSIHTFFMKYDIDVAFIDKNMVIKKIIRNIRPWRMTWIYISSSQVLEVKGGALPKEIQAGDTLEVICTS